MRTSVAHAAILLPITLGTLPLPAQSPRLGRIEFPTSGPAAAQEAFLRAVLYLHSFEYDEAADGFREAQRLAPGFALAYWGEAMSYNHPVWNEQNRDTARAVLTRLGPTPDARRAKAPTPRERAYLEAVEILYGEGSKPARDTAYSRAMEQLAATDPTDLEAKAFYALSLLGLNQGVRDVWTYIRAAAVAEEVFRANPDHPGAAHVLIHSYDDPTHAPLGLPAARAYSRIAPDAAHAQHMTTHIFISLGMWDQVVSQNEIASGHDHGTWVPGHYTAWLEYGYLQQGRYQDALHHLEVTRGNMAASAPPRQRAALAAMRAHYLVNTERWDSPVARWTVDVAGVGPRAAPFESFIAGYGAIKRGDRIAAERALADLTATRGAAPAPGARDGESRVGVILEKELRGLVRLADLQPDDAVALLREAVVLEDAMPFDFGPPDVVKPSHELLGEVLLGLGRPAEAEREFRAALRLAPKRALSLLGLARAAAAVGDRKATAQAYATLREIWHRADPGLPGLAEAAQFTETGGGR